jgi:hypothetical protein
MKQERSRQRNPVRFGGVGIFEGQRYDGGLQTVFELSWLFWLLVIFLFAESWARVWAAYHRAADQPGAPHQASSPDIST